jgi:site-specific DNA-cytosine methylase
MGFNSKLAKSHGHKRGFPQVVSDMQAYKQFGNSVCPLVVAEIASEIAQALSCQLTINKSRNVYEKRQAS